MITFRKIWKISRSSSAWSGWASDWRDFQYSEEASTGRSKDHFDHYQRRNLTIWKRYYSHCCNLPLFWFSRHWILRILGRGPGEKPKWVHVKPDEDYILKVDLIRQTTDNKNNFKDFGKAVTSRYKKKINLYFFCFYKNLKLE